MTTKVNLRNHGMSIEATEADDKGVTEANLFADKLRKEGHTFDKAYVDRFDGLVLVGPMGTYHFTTPLCGYMGSGPMATAQILEKFGFGHKDALINELNHGDNAAKATLYR